MSGPITCRAFGRALSGDAPGQAGQHAHQIAVENTLARHAQHCARCAARLRQRAAVQKLVSSYDDQLDDLTRSRVLARLGSTIDEVASRRTRGLGPWPRRLAWSLGFVAVAAVAFGVRLSLWKPPASVTSSTPSKDVSASASADGAGSARLRAELLAPYAVQAADVAPGVTTGKTLDRLELPERTTMRARLADVAELTLVGPLDLAVASAGQDRVELELGRGTLVGDYDGTRGSKLRVRAGDVTVEITGTLFAIARDKDGTRVSVAHGKVHVESPQGIVVLTDNQSWSSRRQVLEAVPSSVSVLFEQASRGLAKGAPAASSQPGGLPAGRSLDRAVETRPAAQTGRGGTVARRRVSANVEVPRRKLALRSPDAPPESPRDASGEERPFPVASPSSGHPPQADVSRSKDPPREAAPAHVAPFVAPPVRTPARDHAEPPPVPPSPPPPPPARPAAPPSPPPSPTIASGSPGQSMASSLYRQAEAALQRGDESVAHKTLAEIISRFPGDPIADAARFELALMLERSGKRRQALTLANELAREGREGPFVEPARFLRCRLEAERRDRAAAIACLTRFVDDHPSSPHHGQAVQLLIELHSEAGDCAKTSELAKSYLASRPRGPFAARAKELRDGCAK